MVSLRDTSYSHTDDFNKMISGLDTSKPGSGIYRIGDESYIVSHDVSDKNGWQYVSLIPVAETLQDIRTIQHNTVFLFILILLLEILVIYVSIRKNYRPIKGLVSFARNMFLPNEQTTMNEIDTIRFALDQLSSDNSRLDVEGEKHASAHHAGQPAVRADKRSIHDLGGVWAGGRYLRVYLFIILLLLLPSFLAKRKKSLSAGTLNISG